ncbi:MAG TPA: GntR family transcriptional regulator [Clostridiales bacterium]|nr:GntR family transcriptional regulator [Clostridiales bacterium]
MTEFITIGKSKQFYDFLKNEILSGEYKAGDKFPSIRDLAEKYSVSKTTVNLVISNLVNEKLLYVEQGKGTFVSDKKPDSRSSKKMIGVMLFDFRYENNVEAPIFNSIQENLKDDYFLIPYNSYDNNEIFYKGIKGLMELDVDGMILVPPTMEDHDADYIKSLITKDIPIVFINRRIPGIKGDFFSMDFEKGVYKAAKYIIDSGKKRIAMFKNKSPSLQEQMYRGFVAAHKEAGLEFKDEYMLEWPYWSKMGMGGDPKIAEISLKKVINEIDGLIASDYFIYKNRNVIYESGKVIPSDISIVGLNDSAYSRFMNPKLTAIPFLSEEIGVQAVKTIMERIEGKKKAEVNMWLEPDIIIRSS